MFNDNVIPKICRYGYARVSSKSQEENSSLQSQKEEFIRLEVPEKNIRVEVGSAANNISERPIFYYTSTINLQVKLSIIRSFAEESSYQKTYLIRSFLNQYKNLSHSIQAQVKKQILEQFNQLLKAKIIQTRFQVSVNGNNFITKDSLQLQDIQAAEVIFFYEIIYPI